MNVEIIRVSEKDKSVLRQLIELYEYDFTEFNDADVNEHGFYGYSYFDNYWTEEKRIPFFIMVDNHYAGFALVNDYCYTLQDPDARSIAEFFIMKKYRRHGVGKKAAIAVFSEIPALWEVIEHEKNIVSYKFWLHTISEYTNDTFIIVPAATEDWEGTAMIFDNRK